MKKRMIVVLGAVGMSAACTVGGAGEEENLGRVGLAATAAPSVELQGESTLPGSCFAYNRRPMMAAELAVAMAREIGELHPLRDLQIITDTEMVDGVAVDVEKVALSSEGVLRCDPDSNGCQSTRALLELQDLSTNLVIDETFFKAEVWRDLLVAQWRDQEAFELANPAVMPSPHYLTLKEGTPGFCGTDFHFDVHWLCTGCSTDSTWIENRMVFFMPNNTVIDFRSSDDKVIIDPTGSMNDDGTASGGGCTDACLKMASSGLDGTCCSCNGSSGVFVTDGMKLVCNSISP